MKAAVVFPHQLFRRHPAITPDVERVYLIEEPLLFTLYKFHKQKLVLHRAALRAYCRLLEIRGFAVRYVEFGELPETASLAAILWDEGATEVVYADPVDDWLESRFVAACEDLGIKTTRTETPAFINTNADVDRYFARHQRFFLANFYEYERKRLGLLVDDDGKPIGGRWSFDTENRKKLPKNIVLPRLQTPARNEFVCEAIDYVSRHFSDNPGRAEDFHYATTHREAAAWLESFLSERFEQFGPYEDAIAKDELVLFHSVLSHALNCGLLTPRQVLDRALSYADEYDVPINSLEGFVRQIAGWREFMRATYVAIGRGQRTKNFWNHTRRLPQSFYTASTGVLPVDATIKKVINNAYCHHIERLMILGNFMLLTEIAPDDVYRWFMEMFVDAYDWVMVPNVYGISQYADGGMVATKPYISGSNYIRKMSDYGQGEWCEIWDGLFWRFIKKHERFFQTNPRYLMSVRILNEMDTMKRERLFNKAENFLSGFK